MTSKQDIANDSPRASIRTFLTERELAERWSKSCRSVQRMRYDQIGPAYHRIGGSILYKIDDIEVYETALRAGGAET